MKEDILIFHFHIDKGDISQSVDLECDEPIFGDIIRFSVELNNMLVNSTCSVIDFLVTRPGKTVENFNGYEYSEFYPFTCSCGVAECSGIWDGIKVRYRKHSVEWRIRSNTGYDGILDKTFYSFDRKLYEEQVALLWGFFKENSKAVTEIMCYGDCQSNIEYWKNNSPEVLLYLSKIHQKLASGIILS